MNQKQPNINYGAAILIVAFLGVIILAIMWFFLFPHDWELNKPSAPAPAEIEKPAKDQPLNFSNGIQRFKLRKCRYGECSDYDAQDYEIELNLSSRFVVKFV